MAGYTFCNFPKNIIRPSKKTNMFSVPARFLFGGRMDFIFIFTNSKLYFKNRKMSAEPSENKVLASQKFQFYRLSVQLTQSPVHTNDPFVFFPATLCNCSSTNDRVTFVFLHEDRIRQFFIVVATCSRGTDSSVMTSIVWPYATPSTHADVFNTKLGQVG